MILLKVNFNVWFYFDFYSFLIINLEYKLPQINTTHMLWTQIRMNSSSSNNNNNSQYKLSLFMLLPITFSPYNITL